MAPFVPLWSWLPGFKMLPYESKPKIDQLLLCWVLSTSRRVWSLNALNTLAWQHGSYLGAYNRESESHLGRDSRLKDPNSFNSMLLHRCIFNIRRCGVQINKVATLRPCSDLVHEADCVDERCESKGSSFELSLVSDQTEIRSPDAFSPFGNAPVTTLWHGDAMVHPGSATHHTKQ